MIFGLINWIKLLKWKIFFLIEILILIIFFDNCCFDWIMYWFCVDINLFFLFFLCLFFFIFKNFRLLNDCLMFNVIFLFNLFIFVMFFFFYFIFIIFFILMVYLDIVFVLFVICENGLYWIFFNFILFL